MRDGEDERVLVCLCHLADVQTALMNVRFEGNNGHDADVSTMSAFDPKQIRIKHGQVRRHLAE